METPLQMPRKPWWRTLVWAAGPIVLGIAVIVFLVVHYSNSEESKKPLPALPAAPAEKGPNQKAFDTEAQAIAKKWIRTAVLGKNPGASWNLLDPTYPGREEYTRKMWATGENAVVPASYPSSIADVRYRVTETFPGQLTVEVAFFYKKTTQKPELFTLGLRRRGKGANRYWLVDYWNTRYVAGFRSNPT